MSEFEENMQAALIAGDGATVERLARQGLAFQPGDAGLSIQLALGLGWQGRQDDALSVYAGLTREHPEDAVHWRNYAAALRKADDLEGAEAAYRHAAELAPKDAELLELYGLVQMDLGKPDQARDTLLRAFGQAPDTPSIRIHAALACTACRDLRADNLLRPWRKWLPLDDYLQSQLAEAQARQGDVRAAVELLEDLALRMPAERSVRLRLAGLYERVNRLEAAGALLNRIVADGTGLADAREAREIAHQRARLAERRGDYAEARATLAGAGPESDSDYAHWFELARVCDRLGDTAATMAALAKAHAGQIAEIKATQPRRFDPETDPRARERERISAGDYAEWPTLTAPDASQSPVFVVGYPRSGTTLLEQMLDAHPRLQSMDERPFFHQLAAQLCNSTGLDLPRDLGKLDQRDCDELRRGYLTFACAKVPRRWDARLVDKNPMNMLWLPMIHRLFPDAKFILALRHPCDVLLSNYLQNFVATSLALDGENLATLAASYVDTMQRWLHHVDVFHPDVFVSRYEELIADPPGQTQRIAHFLGLADAGAMLDYGRRAREKGYIATPSYTQVIEPISRKSIGRWRAYHEYFEPVLPILQPMLEHWGYGLDVEAATQRG